MCKGVHTTELINSLEEVYGSKQVMCLHSKLAGFAFVYEKITLTLDICDEFELIHMTTCAFSLECTAV